MARIRTIKPEFFTSEDIVSLSMPARLLYIALWCEADREGRFLWKPRTFKMRYFPADDLDIFSICNELLEKGLVKLYRFDGNTDFDKEIEKEEDVLAFVPKFSLHQHINPREAASVLPQPLSAARVSDASTTRDLRAGRKGKERKDIRRVDTRDDDFEKFWIAYPRKDSKVQAKKAFDKIAPNEQLLAEILAGVKRAETSDQWRKDDGRFIPYASTWLNGRRWEDVGAAVNGHSTPVLNGFEDMMRGAL
ncbi:hypothetical protein [Paraburkholderia sp. HD33-4]|uniref:hypothetical protein n=1 Tax=Paraburkholderia sp. HD33-4 TaxID=2883242 RepID=UPI001F202064|nr:hypothetical protein [Paraburkholderia sp. HD33-4]